MNTDDEKAAETSDDTITGKPTLSKGAAGGSGMTGGTGATGMGTGTGTGTPEPAGSPGAEKK
jgi:hypothetical protein